MSFHSIKNNPSNSNKLLTPVKEGDNEPNSANSASASPNPATRKLNFNSTADLAKMTVVQESNSSVQSAAELPNINSLNVDSLHINSPTVLISPTAFSSLKQHRSSIASNSSSNSNFTPTNINSPIINFASIAKHRSNSPNPLFDQSYQILNLTEQTRLQSEKSSSTISQTSVSPDVQNRGRGNSDPQDRPPTLTRARSEIPRSTSEITHAMSEPITHTQVGPKRFTADSIELTGRNTNLVPGAGWIALDEYKSRASTPQLKQTQSAPGSHDYSNSNVGHVENPPDLIRASSVQVDGTQSLKKLSPNSKKKVLREKIDALKKSLSRPSSPTQQEAEMKRQIYHQAELLRMWANRGMHQSNSDKNDKIDKNG